METGLLNLNNEKKWAKMEIFPDISKDASRSLEFERNNKVLDVERPFPEKRTGLMNHTMYQASKFLDRDVIYDNELLILGIIFLAAVFLALQLVKFGIAMGNWIFAREREEADPAKTHISDKKKTTKEE